MTSLEAAVLLGLAKHSMPSIDAGVAEDCEVRLYHGLSAEDAHHLADSVLPRGRRGRVRLVLYPPASARATAFIAAVLRAVEEKDEIKTSDIFWVPPPDHDTSPAAVAARIAAGEESDRRYETRCEARRELEGEEYIHEKEEDHERDR